MIDDIMFFDLLGAVKFLVWSKESEIARIFYRTTIAGHWDKADVEEFNRCGCFYEIHFDHKQDDEAHMFCMMVMQRCDNFKGAKVSKLAVNNMKVIVLLGKTAEFRGQVARLAKQSGFELSRVRSKSDRASDVERYSNSQVGKYFDRLKKAFAPTAGIRAERRD